MEEKKSERKKCRSKEDFGFSEVRGEDRRSDAKRPVAACVGVVCVLHKFTVVIKRPGHITAIE